MKVSFVQHNKREQILVAQPHESVTELVMTNKSFHLYMSNLKKRRQMFIK